MRGAGDRKTNEAANVGFAPSRANPRCLRRLDGVVYVRYVENSRLISRPVTLQDLQKRVDAYIGQFREGYFPPLVNLARLAEEVGELARELNHAHGSKRKKADEAESEVALELGDVLFVVTVLANQLDIDLEEAARRTLEKYEVRDADRWERTS